MTTTTDTPAALRAQADAHDAEAHASFERCDTDGAISQWASGISARKARMQADLIEAGGTIDVAALFNLDGTIASTHTGWGQFGQWWRLNDEAAERAGRTFIRPSTARRAATRRANLRKKGFTLGTIRVRAYVDIVGGGKGLAGAASCYPTTLPVVDDLRTGAYTVVGTDTDTED